VGHLFCPKTGAEARKATPYPLIPQAGQPGWRQVLIQYRYLRMGGSMAEPKLLDQYRERLRVKHYSLRTEDA
jgi:hypothetical protein